MTTNAAAPRPPQPAPVRRVFPPDPLRLAGDTVLIALVLLATFGVFGPTTALRMPDDEPLSLTLLVPERAHLTMPTRVEVASVGDEVAGPVVIRIDRAYLDGFSVVGAQPKFKAISERAFEADLGAIALWNASVLVLEVESRRPGRFAGMIEVEAPRQGVARPHVATFVFP